MTEKYLKLFVIFAFAVICTILSPGSSAQQDEKKVKTDEGTVVQLCDGKSEMVIANLKPGEVLSPELAREVAAKMMATVAAEQQKQESKWTDRDRLNWEREQKRLITEGDRLFHDWKAVGGTIGISCDMCHPNASNTHAETYPKFQPQLKKVAALRDMINWCIENPLKGKPLAMDDPRVLALEAYITSTRKGVALDPGKH